MDTGYKNAVLFILEMEPHIPEMLALDDTLNFLSAGVWEISAAVYGQMEATGLIYDRLRIALMRLTRAGIEDKFEEGIGRAFELADKLQDRIQEIDLEAHTAEPILSEQASSRVTLGELLAAKPGAPLAKIRSILKPETHPTEDASNDTLAAGIVQNLVDSLDILLDSLRG